MTLCHQHPELSAYNLLSMADDNQLAEATQPLSFAEFLERMKEPAAADLVRSIKKCDMDEQSCCCICIIYSTAGL